jgi:uncharacterized protein (DUF1697 family)
MKRYVAFLRGMNLGKRRIKNDELCACFEAIGLRSPQAFLASGNVVFDSAKRADGLERHIADGLRKALNYDVPTFVRPADEVRAIAACEPFGARELAKSNGKLQVALLSSAPSRAARKTVLALSCDADQLSLSDRELYWLPCGGLSESELDIRAIERALGPMTIRTRRTLERIAAKHLAA